MSITVTNLVPADGTEISPSGTWLIEFQRSGGLPLYYVQLQLRVWSGGTFPGSGGYSSVGQYYVHDGFSDGHDYPGVFEGQTTGTATFSSGNSHLAIAIGRTVSFAADDHIQFYIDSQDGHWEFLFTVGGTELIGIPSSEAMGSIIVGVNLTGIPSSEAMGSLIAGSLNLAGIPSSEALGSPIVGVNLTGIPTSEAMGTLIPPILTAVASPWLMTGHDSGLNQRVLWWASDPSAIPASSQTIPPYTGALSAIAVEIPPWALGGSNASVIAPAPPGPYYDTSALAAGELGVLVAGTGMLLAQSNASTAAGSLIAGAYSGIPGLMILEGMVEGAIFTSAGGAPAVDALVFAAPADEETLAAGKFSASIPGVTAGSGKYVSPVGICADASEYSTTRRCRVILRIHPRIGPM